MSDHSLRGSLRNSSFSPLRSLLRVRQQSVDSLASHDRTWTSFATSFLSENEFSYKLQVDLRSPWSAPSDPNAQNVPDACVWRSASSAYFLLQERKRENAVSVQSKEVWRTRKFRSYIYVDPGPDGTKLAPLLPSVFSHMSQVSVRQSAFMRIWVRQSASRFGSIRFKLL